jgi:hypothetical protein
MNDNTVFPALDVFREIERALFEDSTLPFALTNFRNGLNEALDRVGFTDDYLKAEVAKLNTRKESNEDIERQGSSVSKVVKDIIWGMIELDRTTVAILDTPILQRLRYVRQNGFTYLVYPAASHVRMEHSLGVLAVVSKYIASINSSAAQESRFAPGLVAKPMNQTLALDLKHAAILHDIGHFPLSHVLETIFESDPTYFKIGGVLIRDFEICIMSRLKDLKSRLSEKLFDSVRTQKFWPAQYGQFSIYIRTKVCCS